MNYAFDHFLDGSHPGPLLIVILGRHVQIHIGALYSKNEWLVVLIFVIGLDGFDILQRNDFSGVFVLSFGCETIKMSFC